MITCSKEATDRVPKPFRLPLTCKIYGQKVRPNTLFHLEVRFLTLRYRLPGIEWQLFSPLLHAGFFWAHRLTIASSPYPFNKAPHPACPQTSSSNPVHPCSTPTLFPDPICLCSPRLCFLPSSLCMLVLLRGNNSCGFPNCAFPLSLLAFSCLSYLPFSTFSFSSAQHGFLTMLVLPYEPFSTLFMVMVQHSM